MNDTMMPFAPLDPAAPRRPVAVAMSGGVDSSLAAALLLEAGYPITGFTMIHGFHSPGESAADAAHRAADALGIPHRIVDVHEAFVRDIAADFVAVYLAGRTPNPCVRCNRLFKWGALFEAARATGCELLATGHYARIGLFPDGTRALVRGDDPGKDQSYFLYALSPADLARTLFPLGGLTKVEVRREAARRGLPAAERAESQEICFIPGDDHASFLRDHAPDAAALRPGPVVSADGVRVGTHRGAALYTIGQRKGLGIALGRPVYVTAIDTQTNTVTVGDADDLLAPAMTVAELSWGRGRPPGDTFRCDVRIRYRHHGTPGTVRLEGDTARVTFDTLQRAVTPGQSAVFSTGAVVLGGGIITGTERA